MTEKIPINTLLVEERRLGGVSKLYGETAFEHLKKMHVVVIGLGGVGSWAAEALARSAVGEITLIDFDHISISNTNRQLHALDGEYGKAKVEAMSQRLKKINPELIIHEVDEFVKPENIEALLPKSAVILDATDDFLVKFFLPLWCNKMPIHLVIVGGAEGKFIPTKIKFVVL